ncbi:MAG: diguanylate cyclase [Cyanobacteria bacterium P01_H01_bin.15]
MTVSQSSAGLNPEELTLESLLLWPDSIDLQNANSSLSGLFVDDPLLPGLLLLERKQLLAVLSRPNFQAYFDNKPSLLQTSDLRALALKLPAPLVLPASTSIFQAAQQVLRRPSAYLGEPVVVIAEDGYRLLDAGVLLQGQAQLHEKTITALANHCRQLSRLNQQWQQLAPVDPVTKIPNRRQFDENLLLEWRRSVRGGYWLAVVSMCLDGFLHYSSETSALSKKHVLQRVALALRPLAQRPGDLVARSGEEKFSVILPDTDPLGAQSLAEKMRRSVCSLAIVHRPGSDAPYLTASLGVVGIRPKGQQSPSLLLRAVDDALRTAQKSGGNRVVTMPAIDF